MFKAIGTFLIVSAAVGETQRVIHRRQARLNAVAAVSGLDNQQHFEERKASTPYIVSAVAICGAVVGWILSETAGESV